MGVHAFPSLTIIAPIASPSRPFHRNSVIQAFRIMRTIKVACDIPIGGHGISLFDAQKIHRAVHAFSHFSLPGTVNSSPKSTVFDRGGKRPARGTHIPFVGFPSADPEETPFFAARNNLDPLWLETFYSVERPSPTPQCSVSLFEVPKALRLPLPDRIPRDNLAPRMAPRHR